jgi:Arc/MetJ-type ribon-helix-helix transcriptional regulator
MAKGKLTFNVRLSQAAIDEIDRLVDETRYSSRSDLVSRAVYELLQKEGMRPVIREEIKSFFQSAEGRAMIKEIQKEDE